MRTRIPASMRTRQSLSDLIEGRLSSADGRSELVKLATRLIVEETLEAESRDAVGRSYWQAVCLAPSASPAGAHAANLAAQPLDSVDHSGRALRRPGSGASALHALSHHESPAPMRGGCVAS